MGVTATGARALSSARCREPVLVERLAREEEFVDARARVAKVLVTAPPVEEVFESGVLFVAHANIMQKLARGVSLS